MAKTLKRKVVIKRMGKPIDKSKLKNNEYKLDEHYKATFVNMMPLSERRETNRLLYMIDELKSDRISERDIPDKIEITYKN